MGKNQLIEELKKLEKDLLFPGTALVKTFNPPFLYKKKRISQIWVEGSVIYYQETNLFKIGEVNNTLAKEILSCLLKKK